MPASFSTRRIAWDGLSFLVPSRWDLAGYEFLKRNLTRITLEDDYAVRMQAEWTRFKKRPELDSIRQKYLRQARKMTHETQEQSELTNLPEGWSGYRYRMPGEADQLIAFGIPHREEVFLFLRLHFSPEDKEPPAEAARVIAENLSLHRRGLVPWEFYDVSLEVPAEFRLFSTDLKAGLKQLVFQCGLRRLYLWQNSIAEVALEKFGTKEEWAVAVLNADPNIKGPKFRVDGAGRIQHRRSKAHPFGHYEQLARACLKYRVFCRHDQEQNRLYLWTFNHRRNNDMNLLRGTFGPYPLNPEQPPM